MSKEQVTKVAGTVIAENFYELFSTLVVLGIISPLDLLLEVSLNPGVTLTVTQPTSSYQFVIPSELRVFIDTDHALSFALYIDTTEVINDPDAVQNRYNFPLDLFKLALLPSSKSVVVTITNNSNNPVYFSAMVLGGYLSRDDYNALVSKYWNLIIPAESAGAQSKDEATEGDP